MGAPVTIQRFGPHDDSPLARRFTQVGLHLQLADPRRVAASVDSVHSKLRGDFPFYAYGDAAFFLAQRGGRDVGRVAAIVNWHARDRTGAQLGYIGMYEAPDDDDVARALLDAAVAWLAARPEAIAQVVGPVDFSTWYSYRFSVPEEAAARHPTFWLEPVTSDHAVAQWQRFGFTPSYRYVSMRTDQVDLVRNDVDAIAAVQDEGYRFRNLDLSNLRRELGALYEISTRSFAAARLYTPVGWKEFEASYAGLERVVTPELVQFAVDAAGEEVGFVFTTPNYVDAARRMRGSASTLAKLRFLRARGRPRDLLLKTVGVLPERQESSVGLALMQRAYVAGAEQGFASFVHALMYSGNVAILSIVQRSQPVQIRRYAVLKFALAGDDAVPGGAPDARPEAAAAPDGAAAGDSPAT